MSQWGQSKLNDVSWARHKAP